ncbi:MAG: hypothetical protein KDK65_00120 [Chlamydiia bacterium]|nr:hypothetical protein [Chlamydiia bacterium]
MQKKWINLINWVLALFVVWFLLLGLIYTLIRVRQFNQEDFVSQEVELPLSVVKTNLEEYQQLGDQVLDLLFIPPSMRLPNLRNVLIFYGKNDRPDALLEKPLLHFGLTGSKDIASILSGERQYLLFEQEGAKYAFSSGNSPTELWFEATLNEENALLRLGMIDDEGELVTEPKERREFSLPERRLVRTSMGDWEIGQWKVDATLLSRQKARWFGSDLFLDRHGGPTYEESIGKQGIEFGEEGDVYTVFVKVGDALIWNGERWQVMTPGPDTIGYPLLVVKKITERVMTFELWDAEGKAKVILNLIKSSDRLFAQKVASDFKFFGARTRSQFVFEVKGERMIIRVGDWLFLQDGAWKKLITPEEIDNYVNRRLNGMLLVIDEVVRKDDKQILVGTLFNAARSQMEAIEIPMLSSIATTQQTLEEKGEDGETPDFNDDEDLSPPEWDEVEEMDDYPEMIERFRERIRMDRR